MKFYSTNNRELSCSFEEAVLKGLSDDGGLFFPESIPRIDKKLIRNINDYSFIDIALNIAQLYVQDEIPKTDLENIIEEAINFPAPVVSLNEKLKILELSILNLHHILIFHFHL